MKSTIVLSTLVLAYFAGYKNSKEVFETSDGFLFHKDHDAKTHARTLEEGKREVKHYERPADETAEVDEETESTAAEKPAARKGGRGKKAADQPDEKEPGDDSKEGETADSTTETK